MRLFVTSFVAWKMITTRAGSRPHIRSLARCCLAASEYDARKEMEKIALEEVPSSDGWTIDTIDVKEVPWQVIDDAYSWRRYE